MTRMFVVLLGASLLLLSPSASLAQSTKETFTLDSSIGLNAYQGLVEEHLAGVLSGLKTLAPTDEATSGIWERVKGPLEVFSKTIPTPAAVWFAKTDGSYFTVEKGLAKATLNDRTYFPMLMAGNDVNGSLVISKSTGERSIIVAVPIVKNGKVVGALGASLSATQLSMMVSDRMGHPNKAIFYALDAQGQAALHSEPSLIFEFPSDIGDKTLKSAVRKMLSQPEGVVTYMFRNSRRTAIFRKSKMTGWVFVMGIVHSS